MDKVSSSYVERMGSCWRTRPKFLIWGRGLFINDWSQHKGVSEILIHLFSFIGLFAPSSFLPQTATFCAQKSFLIPKRRPFVHENLFWYRNGGLLCTKIFFDTQMAAFCAWKSFLVPKRRPFVHENLFWCRNGGLLCTKNFFGTEMAAFCAWKSFLIPKRRPFVHENLFWYRNGGILCTKIFFDTQMAAFCARKTFWDLKLLRFAYSISIAWGKGKKCKKKKEDAPQRVIIHPCDVHSPTEKHLSLLLSLL